MIIVFSLLFISEALSVNHVSMLCYKFKTDLSVQFYRDTYVARKAGETVNDRNDRAIRIATAWYGSHLAASQPKSKKQHVSIVLLTDDAANCQKAKAEGLIACSGRLRHMTIIKRTPNATWFGLTCLLN